MRQQTVLDGGLELLHRPGADLAVPLPEALMRGMVGSCRLTREGREEGGISGDLGIVPGEVAVHVEAEPVRVDPLAVAPLEAVHHGVEDLVLRGEVLQDAGMREPRPRRDVAEGDGSEALLHEEVGGRFEDRFARPHRRGRAPGGGALVGRQSSAHRSPLSSSLVHSATARLPVGQV